MGQASIHGKKPTYKTNVGWKPFTIHSWCVHAMRVLAARPARHSFVTMGGEQGEASTHHQCG